MLFVKFGLLTCVFYAALTLAVDAGAWALARSYGFSVFIYRKHPALSMAMLPAIVFGTLWLISFCAAWLVVYRDFKSGVPVTSAFFLN